MKKIIIIIVAAVVLLGGAAAAYFLIFAGDGEEAVEVLPTFDYSPGEFFVTNVKDSNRLFKCQVVISVNDETLIEVLTLQNAKVRDTIIFALRNLTEEDIMDINFQDNLRQILIDDLNAAFEVESVVGIWYGDYVMQ